MTDTKTSLQITTLGRFDLQKNHLSLYDQSTNAKKIWDLFKFILTNRDKTFTPETLVDHLWPSESYADPRGTMRRQMHRLRQLLGETGSDTDAHTILFAGGSYRWNPNIKICTDSDRFEALVKKGEASLRSGETISGSATAKAKSEALESFRLAIDLYSGDYLPDCIDQYWVFAVRHHYRRLYLKAVTHALNLLKDAGNFEASIAIASSAIQIDTYEEHFHIMYMEALMHRGSTKQALEHYEHITRFFYQEMGIPPSWDFRQLYKRLLAAPTSSGALAQEASDILAVPDILAALDDHAPIQNAFFCDPYVFKSIYELERRRSQRSGQEFSIAVLTSAPTAGDTLAQDHLRLERFKNHLAQQLRLGDTFAQWDDHQYVVLLPGVNEVVTNRVFDRILNNFPDREQVTIQRINHLPALANNTETFTGGYNEAQC